MSSDPDTILMEGEEAMGKALDYLKKELRGIRTGRASPAMVEFVKVDYYGSMTDLKSLAAVSVPEPTQLLIKPFDAGAIQEIKKAIENSGMGLNPQIDGKQVRVNVPSLSGDRRKQLVAHCKKMGEDTKVALRNVRRDMNKHAEALAKQEGTHYPEDEIETLKEEVQELLKKYESQTEDLVSKKSTEIEDI